MLIIKAGALVQNVKICEDRALFINISAHQIVDVLSFCKLAG